MAGTKAEAIDAFAGAAGRRFIRFDYFGHGRSSGRFRDGVVGRWIADARAVAEALCPAPMILIGSSMGAWIAAHLALALKDQVSGLLLLAPALDFTERLLRPSLTAEAALAIERDGVWRRPSPYDPQGYEITRALLEEGRAHLLLPGPIPITAPVRIVQGGRDRDVPWRYALETAFALTSEDVETVVIKEGDHRLSRPPDIHRMLDILEALCRRRDQA
jgi:pimeloyl-ACP methyl ester carboxylesterase